MRGLEYEYEYASMSMSMRLEYARLRGLVEKSEYERPDTTRHDTTPRRFWRAYISATAGPFHVRSSLVGSYIASAANPDDPNPSG